MKYKYVIFDLDGTLLDTSKGIIKAIDYTIQKLGLSDLPQNIKELFIGPPIYDSFSKYYGMTAEQSGEATEVFRNVYKDKYLLEALPYDGIFEMLSGLNQQQCKLAVATNKRNDYAQNLLNYFGFDKYFECMIGSDAQNKQRKSDIIRECLHRLKVDKYDDAVMIGDTLYDYFGAYEAGIDFVGVKYGFGFKAEKEIAMIEPCKVFDDISGLNVYLVNL